MKFKYFILLALCSLNISYGNEQDCNTTDAFTSLESIVKKVESNCFEKKSDYIFTIITRNDPRTHELCDNCRLSEAKGNPIEAVSDEKIASKNKRLFSKTVLNELRKNMMNQFNDLMKMRSSKFNFPSDQNLKSTMNACNIQNLGKYTCPKGASRGKSLDKLLAEVFGNQGDVDSFAKIQSQVGMEIYNTLNNPPKDYALYDRTDSSSCMSDNQYNIARMGYVETLITKENLLKIKNHLVKKPLDPSYNTSLHIIESFSSRSSSIPKLLLEHPFIKEVFKNNDSANAFFNSISESDTDLDILEKLHSNDISSKFSAKIKSTCDDSFTIIKDTLCSDDFSKGNVSLGDAIGFRLTVGTRSDTQNKDYQTKLALYCHGFNKKSSNPITIGPLNKILSSNLNDLRRDSPFDIIARDDYNEIYYGPKQMICDKIKESPCTGKPETCKILEFYKKSQLPNSPEFKLLSKHNENVDKILSSFVGSAPDIKDTKVRAFLEDQGVLHRLDGTLKAPSSSESPMSPSEIASARNDYAKSNPKYAYEKTSNSNGQSPEGQQSYSQGAGQIPSSQPNFMASNESGAAPQFDQKNQQEDKFGNQLGERLARQIAAKKSAAAAPTETIEPTQASTPSAQDSVEEMPTAFGNEGQATLVGSNAPSGPRAPTSFAPSLPKTESRVLNKLDKDAVDPNAGYNAALNGANMLENPPMPAAAVASAGKQDSESDEDSDVKLKRTPASEKTPQETNLVLVLSKAHQISPEFFKNKVLIEPIGDNYDVTVDGAKMSVIYDKKKNVYREVHDDSFDPKYLKTIMTFFNNSLAKNKKF